MIVVLIALTLWIVRDELKLRRINEMMKKNSELSCMDSVRAFDEGLTRGCGTSSETHPDMFPYGAI